MKEDLEEETIPKNKKKGKIKVNTKDAFFSFMAFQWQYLRWRLVILYTASIFVGLFDALGLSIIFPLLQLADKTEKEVKIDEKLNFFKNTLNYLGIELNFLNVFFVLVVIFIFKGLLKYSVSYYKYILKRKFFSGLRKDLIGSLINYKYSKFINTNLGNLSNTLTLETQQTGSAFNQYNSSIIILLTIVAYFISAIYANPSFSILALVVGGIISIFLHSITKIIKNSSRKLSELNGNFLGELLQVINNFKYIKATSTGKKFLDKLLINVNSIEKIQERIGLFVSLRTSLREPISVIMILSLVVLEVLYMKNSIESIMIALLIFYRALSEMIHFQTVWQAFILYFGSFENVSSLKRKLVKYRELDEKVNQKTLDFNHQIELKDINFSFIDEKPILNKINLIIPKNKTIAFVGESGSGKTTLVDIITSILKPNSGEVLIDNEPLLEDNILSWRSKIGYISQDSVVFNDTVFNNISLWDEKNIENIQKVKNVTELTSSTKFIDNLPKGIDDNIGDKGVKLSGGQKQRISISRELYKNAELIIMDEATSALDSESETIIKQNIDRLKGERTIIIIAHRLSTIVDADIIYVIGNKSILESGSYKDLTSNTESFFSKMINLQKV